MQSFAVFQVLGFELSFDAVSAKKGGLLLNGGFGFTQL